MIIKNSREELEKHFQKYSRQKAQLSSNKSDLSMMALDFQSFIKRSKKREKSLIKIICIDNNENVYSLIVHNFLTYFYAHAPEIQKEHEKPFLSEMIQYLNRRFQTNIVEKIEIVQKESFLGFKGQKTQKSAFFKIYFNNYEFMSKLRIEFERGFEIKNTRIFSITYESRLDFVLRFMIDKNIEGMSWIVLPANKYQLLIDGDSIQDNITHLQIDESDLEPKSSKDPQFSDIAPLRLMSFDIECSSYGKLPIPEKHKVITIAMVCKLHKNRKEQFKVVFQLDTCDEIYGSDLFVFKKEEQLLTAFDMFISFYDPDLILGYNIQNFDLEYLLKRRQQFKHMDLPFWGRSSDETYSKMGKLNSKQMGFRQTLEYNLFGRTIFDLYLHMIKETKLRSYKLNSVSYEYLNEQKEDVHHTMISTLQDTDSKTRNRLAVYCLKDALLPLKLCEKLKCVYNYVEMSRVTGVPLSYFFSRGQQLRIKTKILRYTKLHDMIVPNVKSQSVSNDVGYQGADVLSPKRGYYDMPIATLDFASLYPSIMISHNFCYSTLVQKSQLMNLKEGEDFVTTPIGCCFVTQKQRKGILPVILETLLGERKKAKKLLKEAKNNFEILKNKKNKNKTEKLELQNYENLVSVYNGRQLALKISANSVYGFTGAQRGFLPCLEIASSVTSIGRQMIEKTRSFLITHYTKENGYEFNCDVIYGDTDSVMINFGHRDVKKTMELGKEAAKLLSAKFVDPIKLEYEKIYFPYLLLSKKRYAGLIWTNDQKPDRKDCKGVESVRRDNCLLVQIMVDKVLEILLYEKDFQKAIEYTQGKIYDLFNGRIDISQLIISRSLSKEIGDGENCYQTNQAHVALAKKMMQRNNQKFDIGDRVPYVIIGRTKKSKNYEKSEDPQYAFEHQLPLDLNYYLMNQIKLPLERIFSVLGNTDFLFEGKHTIVRKEQKISTKLGLGKFFQKKDKICLNCRKELDDKWCSPVCESCSGVEKELYIKNMMKLKSKESEFNKLWSECQRCEGMMLTEVTCSNSHCPIYFRRTVLQNEIEDTYKIIDKFDYQLIQYYYKQQNFYYINF